MFLRSSSRICDRVDTGAAAPGIAKALGAIPDELAASRHRTSSPRAKKAKLPTWDFGLDRSTTKTHVESALLAIDVFPRCALLLLIFEGLSLEDAAMLLEGDRDLVRKGQMIGLRELPRNLARMHDCGWIFGRPMDKCPLVQQLRGIEIGRFQYAIRDYYWAFEQRSRRGALNQRGLGGLTPLRFNSSSYFHAFGLWWPLGIWGRVAYC